MSALNWIDVIEPKTGRTSALAIGGRDDNGLLTVTGVLPHGTQIEPKTRADADKLIEWLQAWKEGK